MRHPDVVPMVVPVRAGCLPGLPDDRPDAGPSGPTSSGQGRTLSGVPATEDVSVGERRTLLGLTGLGTVMARGTGSPDVVVAILDGPVADRHPALEGATIRVLASAGTSTHGSDALARAHGTAVAGILVADRSGAALGICPGCPLIAHPIFAGRSGAVATPAVVAEAIVACVAAGARLINVSAAFAGPLALVEPTVRRALDHAAARGVLVVVAAGNAGRLAGSPLLSHPWVIPVTACDLDGQHLGASNLGGSIGRNGLRAPGTGVTSLTPNGGSGPFGGTSAAAPLVTGAIALAWSAAPGTGAAQVRAAVARSGAGSRRGVVPPLLVAPEIYHNVTHG